jgi:hypothetical protein
MASDLFGDTIERDFEVRATRPELHGHICTLLEESELSIRWSEPNRTLYICPLISVPGPLESWSYGPRLAPGSPCMKLVLSAADGPGLKVKASCLSPEWYEWFGVVVEWCTKGLSTATCQATQPENKNASGGGAPSTVSEQRTVIPPTATHTRERGPSPKTEVRGEVFRRLKKEHPQWSYDVLAIRASRELEETVTGDTVKNVYRAMGWTWERADRVR